MKYVRHVARKTCLYVVNHQEVFVMYVRHYGMYALDGNKGSIHILPMCGATNITSEGPNKINLKF